MSATASRWPAGVVRTCVMTAPHKVSITRVAEASGGNSPRAMPRRTMPRAARTCERIHASYRSRSSGTAAMS